MYRFLTLSIFFLLSLTLKAQITRYTVWDFRDSLRSTGIDSLIIYSKECTGEPIFVQDSCHWQEPYYLMWKANNKFYLKKFEPCYRHKILELDSLQPYQFYFNNKKTIVAEEIKQFMYSEIVKAGNNTTKRNVTVQSTHDCFYKLSFSVGADIIEKKVTNFDLESEDSYAKKNIYYKKNQQTKLKRMVDLCEELVLRYNANHKE